MLGVALADQHCKHEAGNEQLQQPREGVGIPQPPGGDNAAGWLSESMERKIAQKDFFQGLLLQGRPYLGHLFIVSARVYYAPNEAELLGGLFLNLYGSRYGSPGHQQCGNLSNELSSSAQKTVKGTRRQPSAWNQTARHLRYRMPVSHRSGGLPAGQHNRKIGAISHGVG